MGRKGTIKPTVAFKAFNKRREALKQGEASAQPKPVVTPKKLKKLGEKLGSATKALNATKARLGTGGMLGTTHQDVEASRRKKQEAHKAFGSARLKSGVKIPDAGHLQQGPIQRGKRGGSFRVVNGKKVYVTKH